MNQVLGINFLHLHIHKMGSYFFDILTSQTSYIMQLHFIHMNNSREGLFHRYNKSAANHLIKRPSNLASRNYSYVFTRHKA